VPVEFKVYFLGGFFFLDLHSLFVVVDSCC